jgi:hypothetical protein
MQTLTPEGRRAVTEIAARNGVSLEAALTLLTALAEGNGSQAQFSHPDLGGMGQWSRGGMIMVGDMFNHDLKYRVDRICNELAELLRAQSQTGSEKAVLFAPGSSGSRQWWPADLGVPASVGAQNDLRYAYFPDSRRLLIMRSGQIRIFDAGEHRITGFSQQQSGDSSLTFNSPSGVVRLEDLRSVSTDDQPPIGEAHTPASSDPPPEVRSSSSPFTNPAGDRDVGSQPVGDAIFAVIERLADLRQKNILTEEEFVAKKRELLSRF